MYFPSNLPPKQKRSTPLESPIIQVKLACCKSSRFPTCPSLPSFVVWEESETVSKISNLPFPHSHIKGRGEVPMTSWLWWMERDVYLYVLLMASYWNDWWWCCFNMIIPLLLQCFEWCVLFLVFVVNLHGWDMCFATVVICAAMSKWAGDAFRLMAGKRWQHMSTITIDWAW